MWKNKVYLAARYDRRKEMEELADRMTDIGFDITARWVYGGEEGLSMQDIACLDLNDVEKADILILFSHPREEPQIGGGRYVEFGYAFAREKRCIVIGPFENCFHALPGVEVYTHIDEFIRKEFIDD